MEEDSQELNKVNNFRNSRLKIKMVSREDRTEF
jgi:hypothetical protein